MKVDRKEFQRLLQTCRPGIEKNKATLEGTDCFIFKDGRLHTYNGYISVSIPSPYPFECAVAAEELLAVVASFRAKEIEITLSGGALHLECGKAVASVTLMIESIYNQILTILPDKPSWKVLPEGFLDALRYCYLRNTLAVVAEKVDGVFIDKNGIFSTDMVVINHAKLYEYMERVWLTSRMVNELLKFDVIDGYYLQDSWAAFKSGDIVFSCRKYIDSNYPVEKLRRVIALHKTDKLSGSINTDFRDAVGNACIFAEEREGHSFIGMEFKEKGIRVFSNTHKGSYSEEVECPIEDYEPVTITVDGTRLKQALKQGVDFSFYLGYIDDKPNAFILHKDPWTELFLVYRG